MKNYSQLIRDKKKRQLTAKGNKFVWKCIGIVASQNNLHPYSAELKPIKERLRTLLHGLIIDEECSIEDIKLMVKNRKIDHKNLKN